MTKTDIDKIARHFACERLYCGRGSVGDCALNDMARRLGDAFKTEYKAAGKPFDRAAFLAACGVQS